MADVLGFGSIIGIILAHLFLYLTIRTLVVQVSSCKIVSVAIGEHGWQWKPSRNLITASIKPQALAIIVPHPWKDDSVIWITKGLGTFSTLALGTQ